MINAGSKQPWQDSMIFLPKKSTYTFYNLILITLAPVQLLFSDLRGANDYAGQTPLFKGAITVVAISHKTSNHADKQIIMDNHCQFLEYVIKSLYRNISFNTVFVYFNLRLVKLVLSI